MAVDASGALVATASAAHEIRVWDVPGGFCTHSFSGHSGIVLCVVFHTRELLLATSGDDGAVILWDLVTKKQRAIFCGHVSAVTALAWTPDHWGLLAAGRDSVVTVWDVRSHQKVRTIAVFDAVETLVVLPRGAVVPGVSNPTKPCFFGTGGEAGQVKFWDAATGCCVHMHHPAAGSSHAREIVQLMVLQKSGKIIVATADCHVAQYSLNATGLRLERMLLGNADEVTALCFAGSTLAGSAQQHRDGLSTRETPLPESAPPHVVVATNSDMLHVLSTGSMNCEETLSGHQDTVLALAVTQVHGCWIAVSGSKDKCLRLWLLGAQRCLAIGQGHIGDVTAVRCAAKGLPLLVSGGADKLVRVWDTSEVFRALQIEGNKQDAVPEKPAKLKVSATVAAHDKEVNCVAVAPNNRLVASGGADRCAKLWQLPALAAPKVLRGHKRGVMDICFAPVDQVHSTYATLLIRCSYATFL
jgi:U3 small nucleolar RNA-associated protein 13